MNRNLIWLLALTLVIPVTGIAWAEGDSADKSVLAGPDTGAAGKDRRSGDGGKGFGERRHGKRPGDRIRAALDEIGATDEQKQQISEILAEEAAKHKQFRQENAEQLKAIHEHMAEAKRTKDRDAMKAARDELKQLRESAGLPAGEQRDRAQQFRKDHADEIQALRKKIAEANRSNDEAAAEAARQELHALWQASGVMDEDSVMGRIHDVLTDEQSRQLRRMMSQRTGKRGDRAQSERKRRDRGDKKGASDDSDALQF